MYSLWSSGMSFYFHWRVCRLPSCSMEKLNSNTRQFYLRRKCPSIFLQRVEQICSWPVNCEAVVWNFHHGSCSCKCTFLRQNGWSFIGKGPKFQCCAFLSWNGIPKRFLQRWKLSHGAVFVVVLVVDKEDEEDSNGQLPLLGQLANMAAPMIQYGVAPIVVSAAPCFKYWNWWLYEVITRSARQCETCLPKCAASTLISALALCVWQGILFISCGVFQAAVSNFGADGLNLSFWLPGGFNRRTWHLTCARNIWIWAVLFCVLLLGKGKRCPWRGMPVECATLGKSLCFFWQICLSVWQSECRFGKNEWWIFNTLSSGSVDTMVHSSCFVSSVCNGTAWMSLYWNWFPTYTCSHTRLVERSTAHLQKSWASNCKHLEKLS